MSTSKRDKPRNRHDYRKQLEEPVSPLEGWLFERRGSVRKMGRIIGNHGHHHLNATATSIHPPQLTIVKEKKNYTHAAGRAAPPSPKPRTPQRTLAHVLPLGTVPRLNGVVDAVVDVAWGRAEVVHPCRVSASSDTGTISESPGERTSGIIPLPPFPPPPPSQLI